MQICINIIDILNKSNLVPISTEKSYKLLVVHASKDSTLANLKAIHMQDWQDCT